MEILLLHPGGLGDVILSLPAVAVLREAFPAARITMAGNTDHLVPVASGYAEKVISLAALPLHNLYSDAVLPDSDLCFWKSFDQIISWTGSGSPVFAKKLKTLCPSARVEPWRPESREARHVSQIFVDSLGPDVAAGRIAAPAPVFIRPGFYDRGIQWLSEEGWQTGAPVLALHPGAGSQTKRWPLNRFVSLARHFASAARGKILIIEGPAEAGLAAAFREGLPEGRLITAKALPLDLLAAILSKADRFAGNDSGIAHLAAALGVPSVVLFGPTSPRHWAPLGSHVKILRDVRDCAACAFEGGSHACLENISCAEVIRALARDIQADFQQPRGTGSAP